MPEGGGGRISWVAGRAHSCDFPGTSSSENLAFHGDKVGRNDRCLVTTGEIKARNAAEPLFILHCIFVTSIILSDNAFDMNIACLLPSLLLLLLFYVVALLLLTFLSVLLVALYEVKKYLA